MEGGSSLGAQNLEHVQSHEVNKNTQSRYGTRDLKKILLNYAVLKSRYEIERSYTCDVRIINHLLKRKFLISIFLL